MQKLLLALLGLTALVGCDGYFGPLDLGLDAGLEDASVVEDGDTSEPSDMGDAADAEVSNDAAEDATGADASDMAADMAPSVELCGDGIDNDGDGMVDEGFPNLDDPCDSDLDTDSCLDGNIECSDDRLSTVCNDGPDNVPAEAFCADNPMFPLSCHNPEAPGYSFLSMLGQPCDGEGPGGDADRCERGNYICNPSFDGLICDEQGTFTPEICGNMVDDDCDGVEDEVSTEVCDAIDNNCDGVVNDGFDFMRPCQLMPGVCQGGRVCDGPFATRCAPAMTTPTEVCDGLDNDCDGTVDEGCDDDLDGYCDLTVGYSPAFGPSCIPGDCDDTNPDRNPGLTEFGTAGLCDSIDNDCDGDIDEGLVTEDGDYDSMSIDADTPTTAFPISGDPFLPTGTELSPAGDTRLVPGDADWFEFEKSFSVAPQGLHFLCRVTDLIPSGANQQTVQLQVEYEVGVGATPGPLVTVGDDGVVGISDPFPMAETYIFRVGISSGSGFDGCDNDYTITCKARSTGGSTTW